MIALIASPLTGEQLVFLTALLVVAMVVLRYLDESGEVEEMADELERLPALTRRDVRRVLNGHRWR